MNPESHFAEQLHAAYPPPEENPDLSRAVLALRVRPRPSRARNALLMTAAAAAVVLVVAVALPRHEPQAPTSPAVTPVSSSSAPGPASPSVVATPPLAALVDRTWQIPGSRATFFLHDSQALLSNGCQFEKATIAVSGDTFLLTDSALSAGPVCPSDTPVLATAFLLETAAGQGQAGPVRWAISGGRLTLTPSGSGSSLTYIDAGPGQIDVSVAANSAAAVGQMAESSWQLPGSTYRLTLADGRAKGQVWVCGPLDGPVAITSTTLTIQRSGPVRCTTPNSAMSGQQTLRWRLDGDLLLLTDGDGLTTQWVRAAAPLVSSPTTKAPGSTVSAPELVGHSWQVPGSDFKIFFTADSAAIFLGCAETTTPVSFTDDAVTGASGWGASQGSCDNTMEPDLLNALTTGAGWQWKLADRRLTLTVSDGRALTLLDAGPSLTARLPIPANSATGQKALANSSWVLPGTAGQLKIADGRIDGSIGACNSVHGPVTISSTSLMVTHPDGPVVPCPAGPTRPMDAAASLSAPLRWHLEGGLLLLTNAKNQASQWVPAG